MWLFLRAVLAQASLQHPLAHALFFTNTDWFWHLAPFCLAFGFHGSLVSFRNELGGNGSHFVGDQSNPELVLPIFGWSTEVGDLRPAHFLSLHALQVLPLIGIWADRTDQGIITIWIAGFIYSALTVALFIQAIFGQPFIRI